MSWAGRAQSSGELCPFPSPLMLDSARSHCGTKHGIFIFLSAVFVPSSGPNTNPSVCALARIKPLPTQEASVLTTLRTNRNVQRRTRNDNTAAKWPDRKSLSKLTPASMTYVTWSGLINVRNFITGTWIIKSFVCIKKTDWWGLWHQVASYSKE